MANIAGLVGIGVSGVVLLFAIVALASDNWETIKGGDVFETKVGLWKICINFKLLGQESCKSLETEDLVTCQVLIFAIACRAMIVLAILMTTGAIVSAVLVMFVIKEQQILLFVAGGLNLLSGFFLMSAMAMYVDKIMLLNYEDTEDVSTDFGYGFALDILAWLAAWVAGGLFIAAKFLTKDKINCS